jgi:Fur family ferric uptake transcriptional regulator
MQTSAEDMHEALRASGLRITLARRVICRILAEADEEHLTAAEILDRANTVAGAVDQSTVYRTLEALANLGYVQHVHIAHDDLGPAFASVRNKYGFVPDSTHFAILGHCKDCLASTS